MSNGIDTASACGSMILVSVFTDAESIISKILASLRPKLTKQKSRHPNSRSFPLRSSSSSRLVPVGLEPYNLPHFYGDLARQVHTSKAKGHFLRIMTEALSFTPIA